MYSDAVRKFSDSIIAADAWSSWVLSRFVFFLFCNKHQTAINAGSWIARFENNMGRGTQDAGGKDPVPCRQEKSDQIKPKCARCHSGILGATTSSGSMRHRLAISSSRQALFIWRGVAVAAESVFGMGSAVSSANCLEMLHQP
jgi:hypothetical protein